MTKRLELDRIGLCETCLHTIRSVLRARRGADPLCCEVLDNCRAGSSDENDFACPAQIGMDKPNEIDRALTAPRPIGLCANCAQYENCTLPRPESGVWHCEDYK
ncbi:MAG: hypothetical protein KKA81_16760 [Bacteroidetes bacterium]|nr:hypothetical protein [Bacteroidota bacterium]